jgi:hypothetical protein
MFPEGSVARTRNTWLLKPRPVYVFGDVQDRQAFASSLHLKVDPGSSEVKRKVARELVVSLGGWLLILVLGGSVSG